MIATNWQDIALASSRGLFSRILVAVDHSESSGRACDYAFKLAEVHGSKLVILHVVEPLPSAPETYVATHAVEVAAEEAATKLLNSLAEKAQKDYGMKPEIIWRIGHPKKIILEVAESPAQADLIVMGSRGLGGLKGMMLGSVSHAVVNHAKVPVLIVR